MLRGRLVAKTPEDPKVVETISEILQRGVQFFDARASVESLHFTAGGCEGLSSQDPEKLRILKGIKKPARRTFVWVCSPPRASILANGSVHQIWKGTNFTRLPSHPRIESDSMTAHDARFADPIEMQNMLFGELSSMFAKEVPLYDRSLAVNHVCNTVVCDLVALLYVGFAISPQQLTQKSGERHGAIRIGRPDAYRWIARYFAAFAMQPHNFYDMTDVGTKSKPVIATAFRSVVNPEHRMFTSLLVTDFFDAATRTRVDALLATHEVISPSAKDLIEKNERQGGLDEPDFIALVRAGVDRIFKWTGQAHDHALYCELCDSGFQIAADIACFESHCLNHLTPNTFCMDLYTASMKFCMAEMRVETLRERVTTTLTRLCAAVDPDWLLLHFKHIDHARIESFTHAIVSPGEIARLVDTLVATLQSPQFSLGNLEHSGFKEFTEGPSQDTPILLRQDAYKALTEPVQFQNSNGSVVHATHTARFGEIEERGYATTPAGRELYDRCVEQADAARDEDPSLATRDFAAFEALYAKPFARFPKTLSQLLQQGLVYGRYRATAKGIAARGSIKTRDIHQLVQLGFAHVHGLRYEDFLPVSAAGIFESNLTPKSATFTAAVKPVYTRAMFQEILGKPVLDSDAQYRAEHQSSIEETFGQLGLLERSQPPIADIVRPPMGPIVSAPP